MRKNHCVCKKDKDAEGYSDLKVEDKLKKVEKLHGLCQGNQI